MTPLESYNRNLERSDFVKDPAQHEAVQILQRVYDELVRTDKPKPGLLSGLFGKSSPVEPVKGLYLWGGVGRGKTYVVDGFFECLPFDRKKRIHFHRFMRKVHEQLKQTRHLQDPLAGIASGFASDFRVLCFDEFIVNDIADAMILGGLLKHLFDQGVTLVATSNIHPDHLYKDGLQRDRFQPAIDLVRTHTTVYEMRGETDYRLQYLDKAEIYFFPHDEPAIRGLERNFEHISSEPARSGVVLEIEGRELHPLQHALGVVWFDFEEICAGLRSQNDYLELAQCFHTVIVSDIPALATETDDHARRLINLVDILYDRNVKFMGSGCCPPSELYQGTRLRQEFERTASRLTEMQSHDYLARPHLA